MNYAAYPPGAIPGTVGTVQETAYAAGAVGMAGVQSQAYATALPQMTQMTATPSGIPTMYGNHRPALSADGSGVSYSSLLNAAAPSALNIEISFDTNSKDPVMVRSRIFIGRLTGAPIIREDLITLFKPFGTILGLNYFKQGYAFVQFSQPSEADAAVNGLNGKKWMGVIIDVHHVDLAMQARKRAEQESSRKRTAEEDELLAAKLMRASEFGSLDEVKQQNILNRMAALSNSTVNENLFESAMADTMICGSCRYVTCDFELFKDHRIAGCSKRKEDSEPASFKCASCDNRFKSAWAILCHLTEFHRMMLYKVEEEQEQKQNQQKDSEETKKDKTDDHASVTSESSTLKKVDPISATSKSVLESIKQQQSQQQQQQQQHPQDMRNIQSSSQAATSQPAYHQAPSYQPVYAQSTQRNHLYSQSTYNQYYGLGKPHSVPPAPEPARDSIISGAPVRYSNGSGPR